MQAKHQQRWVTAYWMDERMRRNKGAKVCGKLTQKTVFKTGCGTKLMSVIVLKHRPTQLSSKPIRTRRVPLVDRKSVV